MNVLDLGNLFLLNGLSEQEKSEIINSFSCPTNYSKGEIIYSRESFLNALGIIIKGSATALTNNSDGVCMNSFKKGDCFGAAAIFGGDKSYVSTVLSTSQTSVLFITETELIKIFNNYPKTYINYINFLSNKVRFLNSKLNLFSCTSAEDMLLHYLCSIADDKGYAKIPISMTQLAKMLGIGRATLYRCIEDLTSKKIILRENNIIKVIKNEKNL